MVSTTNIVTWLQQKHARCVNQRCQAENMLDHEESVVERYSGLTMYSVPRKMISILHSLYELCILAIFCWIAKGVTALCPFSSVSILRQILNLFTGLSFRRHSKNAPIPMMKFMIMQMTWTTQIRNETK